MPPGDFLGDIDFDLQMQLTPEMQFKIDAAMEQAQRMKFEFADKDKEWAIAAKEAAKEMAMADKFGKFAFAPATITVKAGQAVTFTNNDPVAHTSTSADGAWDSGEIMPGGSFTTTLQQPGTYTYHCSIHPFMQATVVVQS